MGAVLGSHILFLFLYESVDIRGAAGIGATGLHPELSSVQVRDITLPYFG